MDARKQVLVVEDDPDIRETLADILESEGFAPVRAGDGLDALEQLHGGLVPDVVLLDLLMPRLDGEGFVEAIQENPRLATIPIISMTASFDRGLDLPVAGRLCKPFEVDELVAMVRAVLEPENDEGGHAGTPAGATSHA